MHFAVFYADGSGEYGLPEPVASTYDFPIVDECPNGDVVVSGWGTVRWSWRALSPADYEAIRARRSATGRIRIRTLNDAQVPQWVTLEATVDPNPAPRNLFRGMIVAPTVEFRRAGAV